MTVDEKTSDIFQKLDMVLEGYYPQMERDLLGLLAIPTVQGAAEENAPFGRPLVEALEYSLALAKSLGLSVMNVDNYVGIADLPGESEHQIGVLAHLDVVPGDPKDWMTGPFEPVIKDGRIYARGTEDDKGPFIASLYAMAALADCGVSLSRTVRLLMGCNEESGMECMKYYLTKYPQPEMGFSPDGDFPLIIGEKGMAHYDIVATWPDEDELAAFKLVSFDSGTVANVVPAYAEAVLIAKTGSPALPEQPGISVKAEGDKLIVSAIGVAAHAAMPYEGDNALVKLINYLSGLDLAPMGAKKFVKSLAELLRDSCFGEGMGIAGEDELSRLTSIPSILRVHDNAARLTMDMRFLLTKNTQYYYDKLTALVAEHGLEMENWDGHEPLYISEDHPLVKELLSVYRDFTGDMRAPQIIGGGTYAKVMKNFVAFGPGNPGIAHQADEYLSCEDLLKLAKIYARAIYGLAK